MDIRKNSNQTNQNERLCFMPPRCEANYILFDNKTVYPNDCKCDPPKESKRNTNTNYFGYTKNRANKEKEAAGCGCNNNTNSNKNNNNKDNSDNCPCPINPACFCPYPGCVPISFVSYPCNPCNPNPVPIPIPMPNHNSPCPCPGPIQPYNPDAICHCNVRSVQANKHGGFKLGEDFNNLSNNGSDYHSHNSIENGDEKSGSIANTNSPRNSINGSIYKQQGPSNPGRAPNGHNQEQDSPKSVRCCGYDLPDCLLIAQKNDICPPRNQLCIPKGNMSCNTVTRLSYRPCGYLVEEDEDKDKEDTCCEPNNANNNNNNDNKPCPCNLSNAFLMANCTPYYYYCPCCRRLMCCLIKNK